MKILSNKLSGYFMQILNFTFIILMFLFKIVNFNISGVQTFKKLKLSLCAKYELCKFLNTDCLALRKLVEILIWIEWHEINVANLDPFAL